MKTRVLGLVALLLLSSLSAVLDHRSYAVLDQDTVVMESGNNSSWNGTGSISASYNTTYGPTDYVHITSNLANLTVGDHYTEVYTLINTWSQTVVFGPAYTNFTATGNTNGVVHSHVPFSNGTYCAQIQLYAAASNSSNFVLVDNTTACFTVGTPQQSFGCGHQPTYLSMNTSVAPTVQANTTFSTTVSTACDLIDKDMRIWLYIQNSAGANVRFQTIEWNGTGNGTFDTWNISGLSTGTYTFKAWLFYRLGSSGSYTSSQIALLNFTVSSSSGSGGNNNTGCGYNTTYFSMYGSFAPFPAYDGDTLNATVSTNCNLLNQTMTAYYGLSNPTTYLASGNWSWTAISLSDNLSFEVANIPAGTYVLTVDVFYGSSYAFLTSYNTTVTVLSSNNSGGGNNTGCGYNASYFSVYGSYAPSPVYDGDTLNATVSTNCNVLNQPMVINYGLSNSTTYLAVGSWSWTAASLSDNRSFAVANIPAGTYVLTFNIYFGSNYSSYTSYNTTITVLSSNNSGGGGGGNNSTGCGSDLANTTVTAYASSSYNVGDTLYGAIDTVCLVAGETFMVDWSVYERDYGYNLSQNSSTWYQWTANSSTHYHSVEVANLPEGNWALMATLYHYNTSLMGYTGIDQSMANFSVSNSTQPTLAGVVMASTSQSNYTSGDTVSWFIESTELVLDEDYYLDWTVFEVMTNASMAEGNASWTAYTNMSGEQGNLTGLADGMYCIDALLFQEMNGTMYLIDYDYACFNVGNGSTGNHSNGFELIEFHYNISQPYDDTLVVDYSVWNPGNWNGTFGYTGFTNATGWNFMDHNMTVTGQAYVSNWSVFDISGVANGTELCFQMVFTNTAGGVEAQMIACYTVEVETSTPPAQEYYVDIDHFGYVMEDENDVEIWASGTNVGVEFTVGNFSSDTNYSLWWSLSTANGTWIQQGNATWFNNGVIGYLVDNISGLSDGTYIFEASLYNDDVSSLLADDMTTVIIGVPATGNNTGGNSTGGNNTGGNNTGGNNTGGNNTGGNTTVDTDGDGVPDMVDLCPNTPPGTTVDSTGCEDTTPVGPINTAPTISNVSITPLLPEDGDTLTCAYAANDAENDPLSATVVWSVNGTVIQAGSTTLSNGFGAGDVVNCVVTVNDGSVSSSPMTASTVILPAGTNDVIDEANEGGLLPSVGTIGTLVAIAFGVGLTRRQDD